MRPGMTEETHLLLLGNEARSKPPLINTYPRFQASCGMLSAAAHESRPSQEESANLHSFKRLAHKTVPRQLSRQDRFPGNRPLGTDLAGDLLPKQPLQGFGPIIFSLPMGVFSLIYF